MARRRAQNTAQLRLVLDSNIVISALLWHGAPRRLLAAASAADDVQLYSSEALLAELTRVLGYRKFATRLEGARHSVEGAVAIYRGLAHLVQPAPLTARLVPRDADDDAVAATAIAARAHAIVSGDRDLTELERVAGIAVLRAGEALELVLARVG